MVLRHNEIYLLFFTGRWAYNKGGIGGGEEGVALKVFPSTSSLRFFLICKKGHDRGLFKFLSENLSLLCRVEYLGDGHP